MAEIPFIDLGRQYQLLKAEIDRAVIAVAASAKYIQGPQVKELEAALAEIAGVRRCVTCGNGTDALTLPLMAWGVGPGDAVFCPTFTFIATAEVVALRGAEPIFVDIDPVTYNIDPADLEAKIAAVEREGRLRPKAVIPVDLFGLPYDFEAVAGVCDRHRIPILEDAAQGFGGAYGGRQAGHLGQAGATSFFPTKPLGCYGDGGAVLTDDESLADAVASLRGHGAAPSDRYLHERVGLNSRLDTIQAAILLVKLGAFPHELELRRSVAAAYESELVWALPGSLPVVPGGRLSAWAQYTVRVPAGIRPAVAAALKAQGIPTMVYYPRCLHLQPAFAHLGGREGDHPAAEKASAEVLSLPMHPWLTPEEIRMVSLALTRALEPAGA
jgi:dTDP-4-amino-4,6-dideoxygalactose transaminase